MYQSVKAEARQLFVDSRAAFRWWRREWAAPAAPAVKRRVLKRYSIPGATWVETGTYRGDTTAFLARLGASVVSLEPDPDLFANARRRFALNGRISLINGTSEEALESVVEDLNGPVCFWLDGHFSGAGTYQSGNDTPIAWELDVIARRIPTLQAVSVLVDDFREFPSVSSLKGSTYPTRQSLVEWAVVNDLAWSVEHDIFIATTQSLDGHSPRA